MRIVIVTTGGARATFVSQRVLDAFPDVRVLRVVGGAPRPAQRLKRKPHEVLRSRIEDAWRARRTARLERELSHRLHAPPLPPEVVVDVPRAELHAEATLARVRDADVLVTASAPILEPSLLELPRRGALNVHYGVAPDYRGEHTIFWALARGDWSRVGVTLHRLDAGIDTGGILARGYVGLSPDDTEIDVLVKATHLGAELLTDVLRSAATEGRLPRGTPQSARGTLYLRKHRTAFADLLFGARRALGLLRPPRLDQASSVT